MNDPAMRRGFRFKATSGFPKAGRYKFMEHPTGYGIRKTGATSDFGKEIASMNNGRESPWLRSVAIVVRLLIAIGMGLCPQLALSQSGFARYDQMLRNHESVALAVALARAAQTPELLAWMRQRSDEGHPMVQYALARALVSSDTAEALKWTAIGRMNYALDSIECLSKSKTVEVSALVELGYQALQKLADANELLWAQGMETAIDLEETRKTRQPPYWICDPGNPNADEATLLPPDERARQRKRQFDFLVSRGFIRAMEARLNANLNPDGYAIFGPDPKYHKGKWSRGDNLVWVDDDTLIFGGFINAGEPDGAPTPMYLWKIASNEVKLIVEDGFGICKFGQEFYSYFVRRSGKRYWREGQRLEDMKESEFDVKTSFTWYRCKIYPDSQSQTRQSVRELEYGGKLKTVSGFRNLGQQVEFLPTGSEEFVKLPFTWRDLRGGTPKFVEFLNAYIFEGDYANPSSPNIGRVWVVGLDGKSEVVDMPRGPWGETLPRYFPVRGAWLVQLSNRGLYLVQGRRVTKLARGDPKGTVVSPNGCRAASRFHQPGGNLWVIDFCKQGRNGK